MAHEINMYAIVQKEQTGIATSTSNLRRLLPCPLSLFSEDCFTGLDKAVEEVKFRMSRYSVTPNIMIIPVRKRRDAQPAHLCRA